MSVHAAAVTSSTIVVAVDVGKTSAMLSVTDGARRRVLGPVEFAMTRSGLAASVSQVSAVVASVCAGQGWCRGGRALSPAGAGLWVATRMGGARTEPGSRCRAAPGCGSAAGSEAARVTGARRSGQPPSDPFFDLLTELRRRCSSSTRTRAIAQARAHRSKRAQRHCAPIDPERRRP